MLDVHKLMSIFAGSLCMAVGIHCFLMPHLILDGGLIGIALLLNYVWGFRVGLVMFVCSLLLFICLMRNYRQMVLDSLLGMIISAWTIDFFAPLQYVFSYHINLSPLSSAILGGLLVGLGFGLMLKCDITTGGTDLIAHLLSKRLACPTGVILVLMDIVIVLLGGLLISLETMLYSLLTVCAGGLATSAWMMRS